MSNALAPGDFTNPHSIVGAYSASAAATQTTQNFEAVPNRFSNDLVYVGPNTFGGTACNVQAAQGKFVRLSGGKRRRKRGGQPTGQSSEDHTGETGEQAPQSPISVVTDAIGTALNEDGEPCRLCELGDESENIDPSQLCSACRRDIYGGRKLFARNIKMNGGQRLGMNVSDPSTSVGTVGAGHPGHTAVDQHADRPSQPASKLPPPAHEGGRRHRRRTKNKRSRKMKKTKRHNRKTRGRKSHKRRHTRKGRKMRGGSDCGCGSIAAPSVSGGSRKRRHSRKRRGSTKKRGGSSCGSDKGKRKMNGGAPQPFSNEPISFGYSLNGSPINPNLSALANPMPYKAYYACENVPRS